MWVLLLVAAAVVSGVQSAGAGAARLVCYVESARATNGFSECTHLVYSGNARGEKLETLLKDYRKHNPRLKIVLRVNEVDKDVGSLIKSKHLQGLEIYDAHKKLNKTKVLEVVDSARTSLSSLGGGCLILALPAHPELLAKYYDLRSLVKKVDLMMVQTHALGLVKKMTYHPSRLSGMWDMMNTDSVVDLVTGLGVPTSKVVISLPATARQFTLVNETLSTPGSPTEEEEPKEIDQAELCRQLKRGRWTLERDQDLSAPYAFKNKTWISFEDSSSIDVKGKYARVRGLAGLALHQADKDVETSCGPTLKTALAKVLNQQSRAPRAAVLRSLEHEILSAPGYARALDALQVSPYRITQVVDSDGVIHSIREDTRTEFSCSRQGYFVHPRSCARFYRCVKFDQLSPEYTVFEFDCPAGLAFDSRYEVCVWPGSLPHSQACPGSSEIAPVPRTRFICPEHEGYYADPENCRWFFACLDHGKSPLTAYEFRCPFGLGFDAEKLKCDWPWLVPACGNIARYEAEVHGFSGATLTGAAGYQGQTADAINVAAHQSLVSGAALDNLVGVQGGFLTKEDALDSNFIASQLANGGNYQTNNGLTAQGYQDVSLLHPTQYEQPKYSSGSLILDDYRLPTNEESNRYNNQGSIGLTGNANVNIHTVNAASQGYTNGYIQGQKNVQYSTNYDDNSGAYVHDPSGDYAEPYRHVGSPVEPYIHQGSAYKQSSDYYDVGKYSGQNSYQYTSSQNGYEGRYTDDNSGQYVEDNSGAYVENNSGNGGYSNADYSGAYKQDDSGKYQGVYRADGHIGGTSSSSFQQYHNYGSLNAGNYINDAKAYTGGSHTLTAGAINVGLVGKTTLVDADYNTQNNYQGASNGYSHSTFHVSQPEVTINHVGTDFNNHDGYNYVTTPTSSGVPTTATPFAVTSALPTVTYKTTFVPEPPKTSIKQLFGVSQPAVTYVQPTAIAVKQTPQVFITEQNQGNYQYESNNNYNGEVKNSGYQYSKPSIKFEDGVTYTTAAPAVSTYRPKGFSLNQQTVHEVGSAGYEYSTASPVYEEPFKKVVAYTTGPSVATYSAPTVATYTPQAFSHQTIHKVESSNIYTPLQSTGSVQSGYVYEEPKIVQYTTAQPILNVQPVSTPEVISHQTLHKVDASKINAYSEEGYSYEKPAVQFEEAKTVYSTPAPIVTSTYKPQSYSHQTIHKIETQQYIPSSTPKYEVQYQSTPVTYYKNPIIEYTQKVTPVTYVQPTYKSQAISHQTIHKVEGAKTVNLETGYQYIKPEVTYEQPAVVKYTTSQPVVVSSTYQPHVFSHQTVHKVDGSQVKTYQDSNEGYEYKQPAIKFVESPKVVYSTPTPIVTSTYQPQTYSHQTIHKVESQKYIPVSTTPAPSIVSYQPAVTTYENPILKYTQKATITPVTYVQPTAQVYTQTYKPIIQQHQVTHISQPIQEQHISQEGYSYSQPEIQRNIESGNSYSDASVVSHQTFHQSNVKSGYENKNVILSTVPSTLVYEDHYVDYDSPKYKAPEYIPPKNDYKSYSYVSSTAAPVVHQSSILHQAPTYLPPKTDNQYSVSSTTSTPIVQQVYNDYSQQYKTVQKTVPSFQQISFSTSHIEQPKKVESIHFSFPSTTASPKYQQVEYQAPEIQVGYKAEDYLPPVVSTETPIVTSTYRSRTYPTVSSTREYLPPAEPNIEYLPPSTTVRPIVKSTPAYRTESSTYKASEYLPPQESRSRVVNYETYNYNDGTEAPQIKYNPYQEYSISQNIQRQQNIVVQTAKSNQLGFGTVGPDAGLVSPVTYTTAAPIVTSTYRQRVKSTTPAYRYKSTTEYQAPEYLPPDTQDIVEGYGYREESSKIRYNPYQDEYVSTAAPIQRKQNIVVEKSKSNLLGFGTVGPDAGLVSPVSYTTSTPIVASSTESYSISPKTVTSTYAPVEQGLYEVTPSPVPRRRTKPKVAVVTKINDFNPFLVRKLGAVCSCQSPVLVLKGKKPAQIPQDFGDFNDYDDSIRGDIQDGEYAQRLTKTQSLKTISTPAPYVTSTFNPIIVPDDSYYQDLSEQNNYDVKVTPKYKEVYSESYVSSTPYVASTTEKYVRVRPRVKAVTVAPTYKTILLNQEVTPTVTIQEGSANAAIDSQAFDRYGPGGWRSRDETLQGSVDCQRAGLFRHPKQCNKFYACRWDCTKQRFTLHVFNCPIQLSFDPNIGACNWPSQGPACQGDTLITNVL